jgi:hypothetical protein
MHRAALIHALAVLVCLGAVPAVAFPDGSSSPLPACVADAPRPGPWDVEFGAPIPADPAPLLVYSISTDQAAAAPVRRPIPFEYSEGYKTRAKVHKYASFATLPLFIANYVVGQDLYNNRTESKKGAHVGLVTGTAVLFGVNTVTGVWNLWEGRNDPNHRAKRTTHGILMIAADVGFLATAMLAPEGEDHERFAAAPTVSNTSASTHRAVAVTSMAIATVSYLIMLIGGH